MLLGVIVFSQSTKTRKSLGLFHPKWMFNVNILTNISTTLPKTNLLFSF